MRPLYTKEEYENSKFKDKLPCQCYQCDKTFFTTKHQIFRALNSKSNVKVKFCSQRCSNINKNKKINVECLQCNKNFVKKNVEIQRTKNKNFCSRSCSATYNNKNKTYGMRRSKLEIYLEEQLTILYPQLHIDYNKKEAINSELDIYIPSLGLAFELNGIFHYEPIYGDEKLSKIQNNDHRKFQACIEKNISLCIIDVSKETYFKKEKGKKYLNIISEIMMDKIKNPQ